MNIKNVKLKVLIISSALVLTIGTYLIVFTSSAEQIHVYYSLGTRHNDQELIKVIDAAHQYVYFAIYYFTKSSIADALIRAKKRGVDIVGIMDRDSSLNSNATVLSRLVAANIRVLTQKHPEGIMHIKALVTENAYASGSYNWTDGANNVNDEVLEIGTNENVRKQYLAIIKRLLITNQ
jgi:phosphatidylserine/phosphatidylglycerophosphate/cardiolipin synthase-like enzyme